MGWREGVPKINRVDSTRLYRGGVRRQSQKGARKKKGEKLGSGSERPERKQAEGMGKKASVGVERNLI